MFKHWAPLFPGGVELIGVQLPGREERRGESLLRRMEDVVGEVVEPIQALGDRPFAFLGYSSGAVVAFAVARMMRDQHGATPEQLIFAAQNAPHLPPERVRHALPDDEFLDVLRSCNGTPEHVLNDEFVMALLLPRIRADGEIVETYACESGAPFSCPIALAYGSEDGFVDSVGIQAWQKHSSEPIRVQEFEGGHMFLHDREKEFIKWASQELQRCLPS